MSFLGDLADSLSVQFDLSSNTTSTVSSVSGNQPPFGSLGDVADEITINQERRYLEEGFLRKDPYETDPKQMEILWQEPSATVFVKKRMYSSIAENYRPDFMDADEKLYYKAMSILFGNKCMQVAALEKLSKIQQVTAAVGSISDQLVPYIISLTDLANNGYGNGSNAFGMTPNTSAFTTQDGTSFIQVVDRLRTLYALNQTNPYTTWINDPTNLFQATLGGGTGVIEITNFTNINTTTTTDIRTPGQFSLNIVDPYESMLISDYDIEIALSDATNLFYNNKAFQLGIESLNQQISAQQNQLNSLRSLRGASPLVFNVDPYSVTGETITVIIRQSGISIPFYTDSILGITVPAEYLENGAIAGFNGLSVVSASVDTSFNIVIGSELDAFSTIIQSIMDQITTLSNTNNNLVANNQVNNYARKKLRFNFSGKLIIQPMDVVHIYMNSKSQYDNQILTGITQMFSGVGILQNVNNTVTSISGGLPGDTTSTLLNPSADISFQAEKSIYVGPSFPNYLWALIRSQFVNEIEGTHVFAGVVTRANDNWSDGRFTISVNGEDNTYYFKQGKVNFKPGVDNFNGLIYDPLTPFVSNFDSVTVNNAPGTLQLLDENMYLLSDTGATSLVKYKQGALTGEKATQGNYIQDQHIDPITNKLTKVFYAPDGLAYKWKQGIGIFTQEGALNTINEPSLVGVPNIYNNVFAGLDPMNVLSLLITGIPYNYATYFKVTSTLFGASNDPQSKQPAADNFLDSLKQGLNKNNSLWGNFIPFKNLVINEAAVALAMQNQLTATQANQDLDNKLQQLATLQQSLTALGAINALQTNATTQNQITFSSVKSQISDYTAQVTNLNTSINKTLSTISTANQQLYTQTNMSSSYNSSLTNGQDNPSDTESRNILRQQINYLTRRMSYDVRANQDKNLLIVDDYYDADLDFAAFNYSLSSQGINLYSSDYTNISEQIQIVSDLLDLEVFADSQGHIRIRPPQYNKMPSSTYYRMLYLKQTYGIEIFPTFLNKLFTDQLTSLKNQIEVIEDQIRLECAILGIYQNTDLADDQAAAAYLTSNSVTHGMGGTFNFLSDSSDNISDIQNLIAQANQQDTDAGISQGVGDYATIVAAGTSTKQPFSNSEKYTIISQALQAQLTNQGILQSGSATNVGSATTSVFQSTVVQDLINRIQTKSGQTINSADYLTSAGPNQAVEIDTGQTIDIFKVTTDLTSYMQSWQRAVKAFYLALKNASELEALQNPTSATGNLNTPGLYNNSYIPEVYQHMIEDETYDDYGPGAGARYVIKNVHIKSLDIYEKAPEWTSVEVHGTSDLSFDEAQGGGGPPGLNTFPRGGNGMTTGLAIDYDMWRNYGFKNTHPVNVPFLTDPDTQLGPYAAMILTRNRSNILQGTLRIAGNEYMQPGEVIYLESRNLLFYIVSVGHNISEGGSFDTTLELRYGHSVGDYIPTFVDTIGKLLYKGQDSSNTIIHRQDSAANQQNLGVFQLNGSDPTAPILATGSEDNQSSTGNYSVSNTTVFNNILYTSSYMINSNNTSGNNVTTAIELRIYHDNMTPVDSNLMAQANTIATNLMNSSAGPTTSSTQSQPVQNPSLPAGSVTVVIISMDDETNGNSPSQKAIDAARNQMSVTSVNTGSISPSNPSGNNDGTNAATQTANNQALRTALFSYIIDCWVTLTQVPSATANSSGTSQ